MDAKNFRAELDSAIQHAIRIYRKYAKQIRALDTRGARSPERLALALEAYRERSLEEYRTEDSDLLMLGVVLKMFGVSYAIDSYVGQAISKQIPEITRQRSYGVREEASYLKNMAELQIQDLFHRHVMPSIKTNLEKREVRAETHSLITLCEKASKYISKSTKGVDIDMDDFADGGMSAVDKEELIASFDARVSAADDFACIASEEQLAIEDK